jgi:hypothetical protein
MNKLEALQNQIEQAQATVAELIEAMDLEKSKQKTGMVFSQTDFENERRYLVNIVGVIGKIQCNDYTPSMVQQGHIFFDQASADREGDKRLLKTLAKKAMVESWGDEKADWGTSSQQKHVVTFNSNEVHVRQYTLTFSPLNFKLSHHAKDFIQKYTKEQLALMIEC